MDICDVEVYFTVVEHTRTMWIGLFTFILVWWSKQEEEQDGIVCIDYVSWCHVHKPFEIFTYQYSYPQNKFSQINFHFSVFG